MMGNHLRLAAVVALVASAGACKDNDHKPKAEATAADSASARPKSKLEEAVQAAANASAQPAGQAGGPPPNGIFAAGIADREQPIAAAPKVTVVATGADPKVVLAAQGIAAGERYPLVVEARTIQGSLPPMTYVVETLKIDPKAPPVDPTLPPGQPVSFKLVKADVEPRVKAMLGAEDVKLLGGIAGGKLHSTLAPSGGLASPRLELSPGAADAADVVLSMAHAFESLFVPVPAEAVGTGASWVVSDRTSVAGIDVVRYRHVTVDKVVGDAVTLGIDVRLYAASEASVPKELPPSMRLIGFNSAGKSSIARAIADATPLAGDVNVAVKIMVGTEQGPGGQMELAIQGKLGEGVARPARQP